MKQELPSVDEYASESVQFSALEGVDLHAMQRAIIDAYKNQVVFDVNNCCMRLAVFTGE